MISRRGLLQGCLASTVMAAPGDGSPIGFAIGTYGMKTMKTDDAVRTIAKIGYDGVELCFIAGWPSDPATISPSDRKTLRQVVHDTGLAVPAALESLTMTGVPEKRAQNIERLKLAVTFGHEISPSKPPVIDTILGGKTAEWEKLKGPMADELSAWARVGQEHNATICFKPHAAQAVNNAERALWLLKQVNSPRIRIIYDYSHFFVEGFTLAQSLQELFPYTAFISVKDSVGPPENHQYLLPGDGKTDYLEYFRMLKRLGYSGFVGVEVSGQIHQKPGYEPVPTAQLCYDRLAPIFDRAEIRRPRRSH
jgi:sugar phosphate isomerase/epimerase